MASRSFYLIIVVPVLLLMLLLPFALYSIYEGAVFTAKEQFNDNQGFAAEKFALGIEKDIQHLVRELELLSRNPSIRNLDIEASREILESTLDYVRALGVNDIGLLDSRGIVRLPLMAPHLRGKNFSFREYFHQAKALHKAAPAYEFITFRGVEAGRKGIIIAMPIFPRDGEFGGVVLFTLKISDLIGRDLAPADKGARKTWAIDGAGHLLYHPDYPPGTMIEELPDLDASFAGFVEKIKTGRSYRAEYLSPEGVEVLAASHPIEVGAQSFAIVMATPVEKVRGLIAHFTFHYTLGVSVIILLIAGGSITVVLLFSRWNQTLKQEVAERKKVVEALRESGERFRSIFESAAAGMVTASLTGHFLQVNPAFCQYLGYTEAELLELTIADVTHPDDLKNTRSTLEEGWAGRRKSIDAEKRYLRKDGSVVWGRLTAAWVSDPEGHPMYSVALVQNITKRKQAEKDLKTAYSEMESRVDQRTAELRAVNERLNQEIEERERSENVLRTLAEGVSGATGEAFFFALAQCLARALEVDYALIGRFVDDPEGFVQTLAVSAHGSIVENFRYDLTGTPCANVTREEMCLYPENVRQLFPQDVLLEEMGVESYFGTLLLDSAGRHLGLMAVMSISPIKNPELATSMLKIFAIRAAVEMERERQEEELLRVRNLESIGRLAAGIAHEINNPLANASLNIQRLERKIKGIDGEPDVLHRLEAVDRNIDRASTIAKELLLFSRHKEIEFVPVNINGIIERAFAQMTYSMENIRVQKTLSDIPLVLGDPLKLEGLFINIFNNAVEAMPDGGALSVVTSCEQGQVLIRVSDTGIGIAEECRTTVFDPFFTTKEVGAGTGLGLSICYGTIKQHNGTIDLSSTLGKGTLVTIELPAMQEVQS